MTLGTKDKPLILKSEARARELAKVLDRELFFVVRVDMPKWMVCIGLLVGLMTPDGVCSATGSAYEITNCVSPKYPDPRLRPKHFCEGCGQPSRGVVSYNYAPYLCKSCAPGFYAWTGYIFLDNGLIVE